MNANRVFATMFSKELGLKEKVCSDPRYLLLTDQEKLAIALMFEERARRIRNATGAFEGGYSEGSINAAWAERVVDGLEWPTEVMK